MKLVCISMIKDECDIIELFIRVNSKVIDRFYIINNGCCDSTIEILDLLKKEGFDIVIYNDFNVDYQQAMLTNRAIKSAYQKDKFDWAFILDADELIDVKRKDLEQALAEVPPGMIPSMEWKTWVPKNVNYENYQAPLWGNFHPKVKETQPYDKVIFPGYMVNNHLVGEGNHMIYRFATPFDNTPVYIQKYNLKDVPLNHFPVRSPIQILTKILIGSHKLSIKPNRLPTDGYHWDNVAEMIRRSNYQIDEALLKYIAHSYAVKYDKNTIIDESIDKTQRFGVQYDTFKYKELSMIKDIVRYDNFMRVLSNTIRGLNKK
jgi:hypothetical protein